MKPKSIFITFSFAIASLTVLAIIFPDVFRTLFYIIIGSIICGTGLIGYWAFTQISAKRQEALANQYLLGLEVKAKEIEIQAMTLQNELLQNAVGAMHDGYVPTEISPKRVRFSVIKPTLQGLPSGKKDDPSHEGQEIPDVNVLEIMMQNPWISIVGRSRLGKTTLLVTFLHKYQNEFGNIFVIDTQSKKGQYPAKAIVVGAQIPNVKKRAHKAAELFQYIENLLEKRAYQRSEATNGDEIERKFNSAENRVLFMVDEFTRLVNNIEKETGYPASACLRRILDQGGKLGVRIVLAMHSVSNAATGATGAKSDFLGGMTLHVKLTGKVTIVEDSYVVSDRGIKLYDPQLVTNNVFLTDKSLIATGYLPYYMPNDFRFDQTAEPTSPMDDFENAYDYADDTIIEGEYSTPDDNVSEGSYSGIYEDGDFNFDANDTSNIDAFRRNELKRMAVIKMTPEALKALRLREQYFIRKRPSYEGLALPAGEVPVYEKEWQNYVATYFPVYKERGGLAAFTSLAFGGGTIGGNQQKWVKNFIYHVMREDIPRRWDRDRKYIDLERIPMETLIKEGLI